MFELLDKQINEVVKSMTLVDFMFRKPVVIAKTTEESEMKMEWIDKKAEKLYGEWVQLLIVLQNMRRDYEPTETGRLV